MALLDTYSQYIRAVRLKQEEIPHGTFPFTLPFVRNLHELELHPSITYVIGENGMGKSTLLEGIAIAYGFNPEGGTLNFNFSSFDSHSELDAYIRLVKGTERPRDHFFFRAETFYNMATNIEQLDQEPYGPRIIDSFGGTSLHEQSHGESFFAVFRERFRGNGLYILDEPEAALSPLRQMSLLARINELVKEGSQFIISTHSPVIMAHPHSKIVQITEDGIHETTLEETDHYSIMKQFFDDRDRLLHHLFLDE
ncbi:AAA family ATPase [Sporosarcina luteola]|uniref:AAA family ATPase n=1 Tax=Sporosarcina luteola TaxID=582850 RepID=UPI00203F63AD|nr:AAA family ATPase [Sporosarcina luteola]